VYADETVARKRANIPNNKTIFDAQQLLLDEIGFKGRLLQRQIGDGALTAAEFVAARELLVRSATKLEELAKQIKSGQADASVAMTTGAVWRNGASSMKTRHGRDRARP